MNGYRTVKYMTNDPRCTQCNHSYEDVDHLLRNYLVSMSIWNKFRARRSKDLIEWIFQSIEGNRADVNHILW